MADFVNCYNFMMNNEDPRRRYAAVSDDPPGAFAISGINSAKFPTDFAAIAAIEQTNREPAIRRFYELRFWNKWLAELQSEALAARVFDEAVNAGQGTAVKILQRALGASVTEDGAWGPKTLTAANSGSAEALVSAYIEQRKNHYRLIAEKNPAEAKYLPAWLERAGK